MSWMNVDHIVSVLWMSVTKDGVSVCLFWLDDHFFGLGLWIEQHFTLLVNLSMRTLF